MSIIDQQKDLESFSDQMLVKEAQVPTGQYPQFLVVTEMQRRKDLRMRAQAQKYEQKPSVAERLTAETGQLGGRGIPAADPSAGGMAPNGMMDQGIAKFASGGMIEGYGEGGPSSGVRRKRMSGYQHGGPHPSPDPPMWRGIRSFFGNMQENRRRRMAEEAALRERAAALGFAGPGAPAPVPQETLPSPFPLDPSQSYLGRRDAGTLPGMQEQDQPRGPEPYLGLERGTLANRAAAERADVDATVGSMRERNDRLEEQADAYNEKAAEFGEEQMRLLDELAGVYRSSVSSGPTGAERELMALRRTPEDMRREKIAMAAAGVGSLIAGATDPGAIGRGMGGVTRDILARSQDMRSEDIALAEQVGTLEEARKERDIDLRAMAIQAEGESARTSKALAAEAWTIEQSLFNNVMEIEKLAMQGKLDKASALESAEQFQYQMELMMQKDRMTSGIDFGKVSSITQSLVKYLEQVQMGSIGEDVDISAAQNEIMSTLSNLMEMTRRGLEYRGSIAPGGIVGGVQDPVGGGAEQLQFVPG
jgi:hypothetical protein